MGLNIDYQALPAESSLLMRAIAEPEFGGELWSLAAALQGRCRCKFLNPMKREFRQEVDSLRVEKPGIENRNRDFQDKSWDVMHFLVSDLRRREMDGGPGPRSLLAHDWEVINLPKRRNKPKWAQPYIAEDWGTSVISGSVQLAPHLIGGQGHPIRYNPPEKVQECAEYLALLELSDIEPYYAEQKAWGLAVYVSGYDLELLWQHFQDLCDLYADAVAHCEGILVTMY